MCYLKLINNVLQEESEKDSKEDKNSVFGQDEVSIFIELF